jgi:hypothetical protein
MTFSNGLSSSVLILQFSPTLHYGPDLASPHLRHRHGSEPPMKTAAFCIAEMNSSIPLTV